MPSEHKYAIRLVIQRIDEGSTSLWRVVGYGGARAVGHGDFSSLDALGVAVRSAIPEFDTAVLSCRPTGDGSSIVYCSDVELTYSQLSAMGLG